jgi:anti-anti-sigma factor
MSIRDQHRRRPEAVELIDTGLPAGADQQPHVQSFDSPIDFRVDTLSSDGVHRIVMRGELDLIGAPVLWGRICEVCDQPTRALRLDLRRLTFMDSSGLHVVLDAHELCARNGYGFSLIGGTPAVRRLFEVSGLGGLLTPQRP